MEDHNQMHGSTQTFEIISSKEIKDEIPINVCIKDFFPKTKKLINKKNQKNILEPLEILNKFRKKNFGVSDFQKKLILKNKKDQKKNNLYKENNNFALEVKKFSPPNKEKNLLSTHSFFPKFSNPEKKTFITDIKDKPKKLFFQREADAAPDKDTVYSSYILKDFASPNNDEYDINLNYNTFYGLFNKDKKFKDKKFYRNPAELEKEKKIYNKMERRIQTEFLQKISFQPNEKYMNKTLNNFNFNKGLYKINDLRGSVNSADKIASLLKKDKEGKNNSQSPNSKMDENSDKIYNNKDSILGNNNQMKNFQNKNLNFLNKPNSTGHNFHKKDNNLAENNKKRGNTTDIGQRPDYLNKNKNNYNEFEKLYRTNFARETTREEDNFNTNNTNLRNLNNCGVQKEFGLNILNNKIPVYQAFDYNQNIEKKHYTFNLNQSSNAHVLHMLRLNQKHEKLGLTKRVKLGSNNVLNERLLIEKFKNNFDSISNKQNNNVNHYFNNGLNQKKAKANFGENRNLFNISNRNNNNNINTRNLANSLVNDLKKNLNNYNGDKNQYLKINNNLFSKEKPEGEKNFSKKEEDKNLDVNENENIMNNLINLNNINNSNFINSNSRSEILSELKEDPKSIEKYSINIEIEKLINNSGNISNTLQKENSVSENKKIYINIKEQGDYESINASSLKFSEKTNNLYENNDKEEDGDLKTNSINSPEKDEYICDDPNINILSKKTESEILSSPIVSIEKILSKKTFENFNGNLNKNIENAANNEVSGNSSKVSSGIKNKTQTQKLEIKNNPNRKASESGNVPNKNPLVIKQNNNSDLNGFQVENN